MTADRLAQALERELIRRKVTSLPHRAELMDRLGLESLDAVHTWMRQTSDMFEMAAQDYLAAADRSQAPAEGDAAPNDWKLPADLKAGHVTFRKGCHCSALVSRMEMLHREAFGPDDLTPAQKAENLAALQACKPMPHPPANVQPKGMAAPESAREALKRGALTEAVARAIAFADSGSTEDWEGCRDLAEAAIRVCDARNPPRCSYCHASTSQPVQAPAPAHPTTETYTPYWQGGLTNAELAQWWRLKTKAEPTDRDMSCFALGVEVGCGMRPAPKPEDLGREAPCAAVTHGPLLRAETRLALLRALDGCEKAGWMSARDVAEVKASPLCQPPVQGTGGQP